MTLGHFFIEQVVGVPVTLNGDLKNQFVETTVGFDTICKVGTTEFNLRSALSGILWLHL
jgi:6-phosphofructokinase